MSNAKWRKVFHAANELQMPIMFAFIDTETFSGLEHSIFSFKDDYMTDCTAHGSFYFKAIFAIRFPRYEIKRKSNGERYKDDSNYLKMMEKLNKIGCFDVESDASFGYIKAYKKS